MPPYRSAIDVSASNGVAPTVSGPTSAQPSGRPGRPRRYEASEELRLIFAAAFTLVSRNGYQDVTVADILAEAGMSTRSFYRHFASKDELLNAMFRRDAEWFAASVSRGVEAAPDPLAALVVWIDEILSLGLDQTRASRAAVLGSPAAIRSLLPDEMRRALTALVVPLASTLAAGAADGSFVGIRPESDAQLISAATWETLARTRDATSREDIDRLRADLLSFVRRALAVP